MFSRLALILCCVVWAGCATSKSHRSEAKDAPPELPASWKPHLLYRLASPYSRLYVEVDAVAGCEPNEAKLQKLREVLSTYCDKPDGIEIVRSDVIPVEAAKGMSQRALGDRYINGPNTNGAPAAFLYVLYYDDAYSEEVLSKKSRRGDTNPFTEMLNYPAIYINEPYGFSFLGRDLQLGKNEIIAHEIGHALGAGRRVGMATMCHCTNRMCLMYPTLIFRQRVLGLQKRLCSECVAELARGAAEAPLTNVHYVGKVLVRSEAEYEVLNSPLRMKVVIGRASEKDCEEFGAGQNAEELSMGVAGTNEFLDDVAKVCWVMSSFTNDFVPSLREDGARVVAQNAIKRFEETKQYSNAVTVLKQAILVNPKDEWSYNALAWMRATYPKDTLRNGAEAVEAARRACELTEWKDGRYIDTLAAAYAETGDFKQAVDFQEQALSKDKLEEGEAKEMRGRLVLYKEGKPYREKRKEQEQAAKKE